jgi:hypothetical protein
MLFWFAGWIAVAAMLGDDGCSAHWGPCRSATAGDVFAAFEWYVELHAREIFYSSNVS